MHCRRWHTYTIIVDKPPVCHHYTRSHCQTLWQLEGTKLSSHCKNSLLYSPEKMRMSTCKYFWKTGKSLKWMLAVTMHESHLSLFWHFCVWDCGMIEHWSVQHFFLLFFSFFNFLVFYLFLFAFLRVGLWYERALVGATGSHTWAAFNPCLQLAAQAVSLAVHLWDHLCDACYHNSMDKNLLFGH